MQFLDIDRRIGTFQPQKNRSIFNRNIHINQGQFVFPEPLLDCFRPGSLVFGVEQYFFTVEIKRNRYRHDQDKKQPQLTFYKRAGTPPGGCRRDPHGNKRQRTGQDHGDQIGKEKHDSPGCQFEFPGHYQHAGGSQWRKQGHRYRYAWYRAGFFSCDGISAGAACRQGDQEVIKCRPRSCQYLFGQKNYFRRQQSDERRQRERSDTHR